MRPYYIFTPHYNASAGIKVRHRLCHELNAKGFSAFIVLSHFSYRKPLTNPKYNTPILTEEVFQNHLKQNLQPIAVYNEVDEGNPLGMPFCVRYLLNFVLPEKWATFSKNEMIFAYSLYLMQSVENPNFNNILFIPVANAEVFNNKNNLNQRSGTCFYASKYKKRGGVLNNYANNSKSFEILRYGKKAPSQAEIAQIFRKSELFYSYEDTTLALEAAMCGCPTVFIPNDIFPDLHLGRMEVGINGYALNPSEEEIQRAKNTVFQTFEDIVKLEERFFESLENFIKVTQECQLQTPTNYDLTLKRLRKLKIKFAVRSVIQFFRKFRKYLSKA